MDVQNYIPHSLIKDIYPRLNMNNELYLAIRLNNGFEYNTLPYKSHIKTDANGITGNFILKE